MKGGKLPGKRGSRRGRPADTPEGREKQLISKAVDLAERQIEDGTATSQVITHFLKLGSSRELLEQERLRGENEVLVAKVEQMAAGDRFEELTNKALDAMRGYSGQDYDEPIYED